MSVKPVKPGISETDAALALDAAQRVVRTHERVSSFIRVGMTLAQVDAEVARVLESLDARSCFRHYKVGRCPPFPSHACLSLNDCVVHGTAGLVARPLVAGDLLKIDIGVHYRGFVGDAAWTYSLGPPTPEVARLMLAGKESLRRGIQKLTPDNRWIDWAREVQAVAEGEFGFHLVRGLGGHGYGRKLHAPPYVSNVVPDHPSEWREALDRPKPGTLVAVEPMLAAGTHRIRQADAQWPVYSADGSMTVHYEHDILITDGPPTILSHGMENLPDVVG